VVSGDQGQRCPDRGSRLTRQYFATLGNRAIYDDGWIAATTPGTLPWALPPSRRIAILVFNTSPPERFIVRLVPNSDRQSQCMDGAEPVATLIQATDGSLYGTTNQGGPNGVVYGFCIIFKVKPSGKLTTIHNFDGTDGASSGGGVVQATNGKFYGTTGGGPDGEGTVFGLSVGLGPFVETLPAFGKAGIGYQDSGDQSEGRDQRHL